MKRALTPVRLVLGGLVLLAAVAVVLWLVPSNSYLLLPDTAIATDKSRKIVFVVKDDNTVEAKPVVLGPLDEGLRVVRSGLNADDKVIVEGLQRARVGAGAPPRPRRPRATGSSAPPNSRSRGSERESSRGCPVSFRGARPR